MAYIVNVPELFSIYIAATPSLTSYAKTVASG
jgi:hypothetical protein